MTEDLRLIYMTASSDNEALSICETLVAERLVACANILGPMRSIYYWQGKVQRDDEVAVLMKTQARLVEKLSARINDLHSYDCPCVVSLPIAGGHPPFLKWIGEETSREN